MRMKKREIKKVVKFCSSSFVASTAVRMGRRLEGTVFEASSIIVVDQSLSTLKWTSSCGACSGRISSRESLHVPNTIFLHTLYLTPVLPLFPLQVTIESDHRRENLDYRGFQKGIEMIRSRGTRRIERCGGEKRNG